MPADALTGSSHQPHVAFARPNARRKRRKASLSGIIVHAYCDLNYREGKPQAMKATQRAHSLAYYIALLKNAGILKRSMDEHDPKATETRVKFVTDNSHEAQAGTLFICKGATFKRDYLVTAVAAGAIAYVSEVDYGVAAPAILVTDIRRALGMLANEAWGHPSGALSLCAFTGTKGKTTCAYYLKGILDARAARLGLHDTPILSSVAFDDGIESGFSHLTTPEPLELQRHIANAAASGAECMVMEASSQALKYGRTFGCDFAIGAFINIGEDHISPIEHPSFEDYFASKLRLFEQCRHAVVNLDSDHANEILAAAAQCKDITTYSLSNPHADVFAEHMERCNNGTRVLVRTPKFDCSVDVPTPARFNVSNALCAIACALHMGAEGADIVHGFEGAMVPGRMELHPSHSGRIIGVVDYAHNGMALEALLRDLREHYPGREICVVFGATGGKAIDRRKTLGEAAGKYADRVVITEDDPGPENVEDICSEIAKHVAKQGNDNWQIVLDRTEAIRTAVCETVRPAIVIAAGKGAETQQKRDGHSVAMEPDGEVLQRALDEFDAR